MFTMFTLVDKRVDDENKCRRPVDCFATSPRRAVARPGVLMSAATLPWKFRAISMHSAPKHPLFSARNGSSVAGQHLGSWLGPAFVPVFQPPKGRSKAEQTAGLGNGSADQSAGDRAQRAVVNGGRTPRGWVRTMSTGVDGTVGDVNCRRRVFTRPTEAMRTPYPHWISTVKNRIPTGRLAAKRGGAWGRCVSK